MCPAAVIGIHSKAFAVKQAGAEVLAFDGLHHCIARFIDAV